MDRVEELKNENLVMDANTDRFTININFTINLKSPKRTRDEYESEPTTEKKLKPESPAKDKSEEDDIPGKWKDMSDAAANWNSYVNFYREKTGQSYWDAAKDPKCQAAYAQHKKEKKNKV